MKTVNGYHIKPNADLRGADLSRADLIGADLIGADLTEANLTEANLRGADLRLTYLRRADLSGTDLRGANLSDANLSRADLSWANLRGANLEGAILPEGVPSVENIDQAILNQLGSDPNSFDMAIWHSECGTTHCRAGWAVELAGKAGKELEYRLGPSAAAALIYAASGSHPTPHWHDSNEDAIKDMRKRAKR